jgi:dihydrofolate reductase
VNHPEIVLFVARADNGIIGQDGHLPWHIPADLRRFKSLTMNAPMIMGRKTFDSLPGLLPGRRHIVLTRDADWQEDGAEPAHDVGQALSLANAPHVSVIGGAEIYRLFLPRADKIELTRVHLDAKGDTHLEPFDAATWHETKVEAVAPDNGRPGFDWVTLTRT